MDAFTHLYIPSSMLWKGSDLIVAAGKSTEEHFAVKDLSDGVKGFFFCIIRSRERAIDLEGRNLGFLLARYQDLDVYVPY